MPDDALLAFMMAVVAPRLPEMLLLGRGLCPSPVAIYIAGGFLFNAVPSDTTSRRTS